ncbi:MULTISPECIES: YpuI family protein [Bacillus cereus group]|uniref:DUF3907 domain-containing protein n=1 Tax=Bacillus cytotoxicus (strain DSM 22905 / CIP 110041 / 391-98 / NVH 391-98) TaxID=315749 RepID=A7GN05_BACCN|nr:MULTISPECIES: YpuI family protein [Bacillus cereus group]ABS21513.1 conserved hypothetical protein [Bacillus cytotoxicus NVH 391-98]AWC44220.1 DUF3907 domain-containing protein [Bacillus cytotoxicus]MDH2862876.1 YpuI family protein [Bacillus cytotoxicus]MDH2879299.1 YpuI family protein [Bacillus cytotoxicus]MDH2883195.1 YpuI family protein [Bacillus cytotoxicus]
MSNSMVENQTEQVSAFLEEVIALMTNYVNYHSLPSLLKEAPTGDKNYYEGLLAAVRRLLVFCEEGLDACLILLNSQPFRKTAAEKTLYKIYHQVIAEFFSPKNDQWYENSRSAYTGKNSIVFQRTPPSSMVKVMKELEGKFQTMREELEYYETDYQTKMLHKY